MRSGSIVVRLVIMLCLLFSTLASAATALNLNAGWNLLANGSAASIDVATTFGDASKFTTVWKWNRTASKWAFYAPSMTASNLANYASGKGYDILTTIDSKEGFWVNASTTASVTGPTENGATLVQSDLIQGWNLVGSSDNKTPSRLNQDLGSSLYLAGKSITTAWAWDAQNTKWKFYAPSLEVQGGTALADYILGKGYLSFSAALSASDGFWLNIGAATSVALPASPTGAKLTSGNSQVTLDWSTAVGATSYSVYYKNTPGVTIDNGTRVANVSPGSPITGLTNGTAYYFVVLAENVAGESAVSSELGATPQAPSVGVPSGLNITGGEIGQVTLNWAAVEGATSYNVYYSTSPGVTTANGTKITGVSPGSAIDLANGATYYFIVTALNGTFENPVSTDVSATPRAVPNLIGGVIQTPLTMNGTVTTFAPPSTDTYAFPPSGLTTDGTNLFFTMDGSNAYGFNYTKGAIEISTGVRATYTGLISGPNFNTVADGITTDGNSLYVASDNHIVKRAIATGVETFLAGMNHPNLGITIAGSADGTGNAAQFRKSIGITTDGTNLYVADTDNNTIRKVVLSTGLVSTIANTGVVSTIAGTAGLSGITDDTGAAARFNAPTGITTDGTNLYVADTGNSLIRKVVIANGAVTTLAGGWGGLAYDGTGVRAKFNAPRGITTDGTNLYVADTGNNTIRRVVISTGEVTTIAGSPGVAGKTDGTGAAALFNAPRGIISNGKSLFVTDFGNGVIRKIE